MNIPARRTLLCLLLAALSVAATFSTKTHLTVRRIAALAGPAPVAPLRAYNVQISGLGSTEILLAKPEGTIRLVREYRFPTEFDPPHAAADQPSIITPITPAAFDQADVGWTVRLTATAHGQLIGVHGVAEWTSMESAPGGYGEVAGSIYSDRGEVITPNRLDQPVFQTTATHFHLFALPGVNYPVNFRRGSKIEQHLVTVTTR